MNTSNFCKKLFSAVCLIGLSASQVVAQKAICYTTTPTLRWQKSSVASGNLGHADLTVYPDSVLQKVDGFGGTFNELEWDAMQYVSDRDKDAIMRSLFAPEGIHFAIGRTPVGSNDLSLSVYTYNEVKDDYGMRNFSVARDRYTLIPMIRRALAIRPDLKMWASPWTPPMWMKINEHYSLLSHGIENTEIGHNRLDPNRNVALNVTAFNMQVGYLKAYALYLSKYVQEYQKAGVPITIIMPQNEIAWEPCWQCCTWRPEDLALFVGQYLGPQFDQDHLSTEIWLGTINYPNPDYVRKFMSDKKARTYIKGIGMQWSGMYAIPTVHKEYGEYPLMQTEGICGNGENDWSALENTWKRIRDCFNHGVNSYMQWNMVLADSCKSLFGWKQNSLIIIDSKTGTWHCTDEYYLMKHLSHFIQPGSRMLRSSGDEDMLAFLTAEGRIAVIIYNPSAQLCTKTLRIGEKVYRLQLKGKSVNTIIL